MGFLDDARAKLTDAVDKHGDKISDGLTKAGAAADAKTGGKYTDKIAAGVDKARGALDGLDGKQDDLNASIMPPPSEPPPPIPTDPTTPDAPRPVDPGLPTDPANPATGQAPDARP